MRRDHRSRDSSFFLDPCLSSIVKSTVLSVTVVLGFVGGYWLIKTCTQHFSFFLFNDMCCNHADWRERRRFPRM